MSDKGITTINPTTEEKLAFYPFMTDHELTGAIENCHEAFLEWKTKTVEERGESFKSNRKKTKRT